MKRLIRFLFRERKNGIQIKVKEGDKVVLKWVPFERGYPKSIGDEIWVSEEWCIALFQGRKCLIHKMPHDERGRTISFSYEIVD